MEKEIKGEAIIVDIDGTIADNLSRDPRDYTKVLEDFPICPVIDAVWALARESTYRQVLLVTARPDSCRDDTMEWLSRVGMTWNSLYMRETGDYRSDYIVKEDIYVDHIEDNFDVLWVFEDRSRVVDMWRGLGLTCFQVAEGDF